MKYKYELWQIQPESDCPFLFMGMDGLKKMGYSPEPIWYDRADTGVFETNANVTNQREYALECIYANYNPPHRPSAIRAMLRSMSVSDVIILETDGVVSAWYCDSVGFRRIEGFGWEKMKGVLD